MEMLHRWVFFTSLAEEVEMGAFDWLFGKKDEPNRLEMSEGMWGFMAEGADSYQNGYEQGKREGNRLEYQVTLHIDDFKEFESPSGRRAPMTGTMTCRNIFGENLEIRNAEYGLYSVDPETGQRRITYRFDFTARDGKDYRFSGYKVIVHEPWALDILEDQTTLFATVSDLAGAAEKVVCRGIIHYHVEDFPDMLLSIRTPGMDTLPNRIRMANKFFSFVSNEISEYFQEINPFYAAKYSNMVCTGMADANGKEVEFFIFSGAHDKGFPWGDNVSFWDIGLVLGEAGNWRRFALTEYAIKDMKLNLTEGIYQYEGPIFEVTGGYQISFGEIHRDSLPDHIREAKAKISLRFRSKEVEIKHIPFEFDQTKLDALPADLTKRIKDSGFFEDLKRRRGDFAEIGYRTEIRRLTAIEGEIAIDGTRYEIKPGGGLGEGEFGRISAMRKPALYYNYFCAIEPQGDSFRVQVRSGVLPSLSNDLMVRETEEIIGKIIGQMNRMDLLVKGEEKESIEPGEAERLIVPVEDLLEINNDHFPTGTFQRRIVALPGTTAGRALALEEDMSVVEVAPIGTDRITTVAAIKEPDRFRALDTVLEVTGFFDLLDKARSKSGKTKEHFSIIVKPNFSFMYSLADISSFTDPTLVEHLIDRIHEKGYRNLAVAEAQSTYTTFADNRDIAALARYIGLRGRNYKIIDLSEDTVPHHFPGDLGDHEAHPAWRDADFRISFAKNKTHSYAYYTLTIKNIYGALPKKNKFKEYHCNKELGIFKPTINFIDEFPIHFGLIDAYFSADGPFGIFADVEPNYTGTIIGGEDIVAVDWVGSSKMGYNPMISEYMQRAVKKFGKPRINLVGDHSTYAGWRNVPEIISRAAFDIMDRNHLFGDFLYSTMVTMDPFFTFRADEVSRRVGRVLTQPARKILFEWVRGNEENLTREHLRSLFDREQWEYMEKVLKSAFE
jgi:uncharacterized protein (DUF362 family)